MNTNEDKLLLKDEVFQVVGCAIEILNKGHKISLFIADLNVVSSAVETSLTVNQKNN